MNNRPHYVFWLAICFFVYCIENTVMIFFCYWGTVINYKLDNYILGAIYLTINTFFCQMLKSRFQCIFVGSLKATLLYRGTPHLDQIDSHQFGLVLFQHAFFAVYPAYPTTNGCRFRHRIIYPFFCACPGFPLLFCFSFVFANFRLEFEFQVLLVILLFDTPKPKNTADKDSHYKNLALSSKESQCMKVVQSYINAASK